MMQNNQRFGCWDRNKAGDQRCLRHSPGITTYDPIITSDITTVLESIKRLRNIGYKQVSSDSFYTKWNIHI